MGVIELKRKHDAAAVNSSLVRRPIRRWAPLFMGPMLCAFAIGFVYPFCKGVYLSFCKFKTTSDAQFIGFGNYIKALNDASFVHSFWYTALFALVSLVFINVLAFAVAYALTQGIKGSNLFRTVFFMPNLIGGIVLGYVWSMIFDGILSRYGTSILLETKYGFWGLIILMCWQQVGYMMIIYIAGLQAVPEDMLEAAKIDGANRFQQIWHVTLPGLKDTFFVLFLLSISNILSSGFDHYFVFNNPMVSDKLMVLDLWTYQLGIGQADYSYSIAVGIIRTFVSLILLFTANGISKKIRGYSIV